MRTSVTLGGPATILAALLLVASPVSAYYEGNVVTIRNPTRDVCLIQVAPTPLGESGVECAHGSVEATIISCSGSSAAWGCSFRVTVTLGLDPGVCGYVTVDAASTSGCWNPEGAQILPSPPPSTQDGGWHEAHFDGLRWIAVVSGSLVVQDPGADLSEDASWPVQMEVPPPPAQQTSGCPADGSHASVAAGVSSTGASVFVPNMGVAVQEYVSPLHANAAPTAGSNAEFNVRTQTMTC